jgi:hypothetical protein
MLEAFSFVVSATNCLFKRKTARIHTSVIASKKSPMYGAHADRVPRKRMRNC